MDRKVESPQQETFFYIFPSLPSPDPRFIRMSRRANKKYIRICFLIKKVKEKKVHTPSLFKYSNFISSSSEIYLSLLNK